MTLEQAISVLEKAGIESARFEAQLLLGLAAAASRTQIIAQTYPPLTPEQTHRFIQLVLERRNRVPLAYLRGTQEFYGLTFAVGEEVLIPRPETELLVDFAREKLNAHKTPPLLADVGTGSGCIIISVLKHLPTATAVATDLSANALTLARRNAQANEVAHRIDWVRTNLLEGITSKFDAILSNPPYIPTQEVATLQPEVKDNEPLLALDGGEDGLAVVRPLIESAFHALKRGGYFAMEGAKEQAPDIMMLFKQAGFQEVGTKNDIAGIERVIFGRKP